MKKRTSIQSHLTPMKLGALILSALLFASSCGSSDSESNSVDLLSSQPAENQNLTEEEPVVATTTAETTTTTTQVVTTTTQPEEVSPTFNQQEQEVLTANYLWMESSEAVETLQEILGVEVDGIYGSQTRRAHSSLLSEEMLPSNGVPD